jgi:hypothetical protein
MFILLFEVVWRLFPHRGWDGIDRNNFTINIPQVKLQLLDGLHTQELALELQDSSHSVLSVH